MVSVKPAGVCLMVVGFFLLLGCEPLREVEPVSDARYSSSFENRGLYLWGVESDLLPAIVGDTEETDRFFERAESWGVNTVYLFWWDREHLDPDRVSWFIGEAHQRGMRVEALIGTLGLEEMEWAHVALEELNAATVEMEDKPWFDGIHLDVEPGGDPEPEFLDEYKKLIDRLGDSAEFENLHERNMAVSMAVAWGWARDSETWNRFINDSNVDYLVVMAYRRHLDQVFEATEVAVDGTDTPYAIAVDMEKLTQGYWNTLFRSPRSIESAVNLLEGERMERKFQGTVIHHYETAQEFQDFLE